GGLVFWGDIGQVLRAFDVETGEILWESEPLGASVQNSTITYAVDGRQYVAVVNGEQLTGAGLLARAAELTLPENRGNSINVFALPEGARAAGGIFCRFPVRPMCRTGFCGPSIGRRSITAGPSSPRSRSTCCASFRRCSRRASP